MVTIERIEPLEQALERLKKAPLEAAKDEKIQIYKNASFRVVDIEPSDLNFTSLYVLNGHLESLRRVRSQFIDLYQIDILQLSNILHLRTDDGQLLGMAPPFVEIYEETVQIIPLPEDRQPPPVSKLRIPILKDGVHRAWLAKEEKCTLKCLTVSGALKKYLPYAYPNSLAEIKLYEAKPELKKFYRRQDPYSYMRPLNALRQTGDTPPLPEWGR